MAAPPPVLTAGELARVTQATLAHYDDSAQRFWEGTRDHDVSQNVAALLDHIEGEPPWTILDVGCGPGRDLLTFQKLGHRPVGLEGAASFVQMARAISGCEVLHQDLLHLNLPGEEFDGIFANASLFHVPTQELPRVLGELLRSLKPRGVLFASNPHGTNNEGWFGERYCAFHDLLAWQRFLSAAGFEGLTHFYRPPGLPRHQQPWLASVWRRPGPPGG